MIGEDTLVMTREGFVPVSDLQVGDEILSQHGDFIPIFALGEWVPAKYKFVVDNEVFHCTDSLFIHVARRRNVSLREIVQESMQQVRFCDINVASFGKDRIADDGYGYWVGIDVPERIPPRIMNSGTLAKLGFFAGLVDSVNGKIMRNGSYKISSAYPEMLEDLKILVRLLGWNYEQRDKKSLFVYTTGALDGCNIPVRDPYKKRCGRTTLAHKMRIKHVFEADKDVMCREILAGYKGQPTSYLIGRSLLPVV